MCTYKQQSDAELSHFIDYRNITYLLWAKSMCGVHKMSADHGEHNTETMLGREFHTLLKLVLKDSGVKAEIHRGYLLF